MAVISKVITSPAANDTVSTSFDQVPAELVMESVRAVDRPFFNICNWRVSAGSGNCVVSKSMRKLDNVPATGNVLITGNE